MREAVLLLQGLGKRELPMWAGYAVLVYFIVRIVIAARSVEQRRKLENQPHTLADSAFLMLSGLIVVSILLIPILFNWPFRFTESRIGFYAIVVIVSGGLTYLFNRKRKLD